MRGNITRRGKSSWRLKFDVEAGPAQRQSRFVTVRGTKKDAERELAKLINAVHGGGFVEPSKLTVAEFVRSRVAQWEAAGDISARTAQRYRQLVENQIVPHIGTKPLQKLRPIDIEEFHTTLRNGGRVRGKGGLAPRTIGHAHRVLSKALSDAARNEVINRNVAAEQSVPKVPDDEIAIVHDVPALVEKLRTWRLGTVGMVALFTGMRLGEILALRWACVDFDQSVIHVREALERTDAHGIRFKQPKSRAGRRDISMPDNLVEMLRQYRKDHTGNAPQAWHWTLHGGRIAVCRHRGQSAVSQCRVGRVGRFPSRDYVPRVASYPCISVDRCRRGYRDDQPAARAQEAGNYIAHLRPHVQKG